MHQHPTQSHPRSKPNGNQNPIHLQTSCTPPWEKYRRYNESYNEERRTQENKKKNPGYHSPNGHSPQSTINQHCPHSHLQPHGSAGTERNNEKAPSRNTGFPMDQTTGRGNNSKKKTIRKRQNSCQFQQRRAPSPSSS